MTAYPPYSRAGTSESAAAQIAPKTATLREQVYADIRDSGDYGLTDAEIQEGLGISGDTERPRRWELERAGRIVDSGRTRLSPSGRKQIVWIAKEEKP